jgi:hypothetical protein
MTFDWSRNRSRITHGAAMRLRPLGSGLILLMLSPTISAAWEGPPPSRTVELAYRATVRDVPAGAKSLDLWLPLPQTDRNQTIHRVTIDAPNPVTIGREARSGNQ